MSVLKDIEEMSANELSILAECGRPDSDYSSGAMLLKETRDAFLAEVVDLDEGESVSDRLVYMFSLGYDWEIAQGEISVYTHEMWLQFVDLQAYYVELGPDAEAMDMGERAHEALEQIGARLFRALTYMIQDSGEFDSE